MPTENWNGKYQAVGNGAFSGSVNYPRWRLRSHVGMRPAPPTPAIPETQAASHSGILKRRSISAGARFIEMTVTSKAIIAAYYDSGPRLSYWNGCSAGGRQALKEAQRFPADYDGIIAATPGLDWTGRASQAVRGAQR